MELIAKPWGNEIVHRYEHYAVKVLYIRAGCRLSLQYHDRKTETLMVHRGSVLIDVDGETQLHHAGAIVHIPAGTVHRIIAPGGADVEIFEVSTLELDDVVRLDDDYGRAGDLPPAA